MSYSAQNIDPFPVLIKKECPARTSVTNTYVRTYRVGAVDTGFYTGNGTLGLASGPVSPVTLHFVQEVSVFVVYNHV